MAFWPWIMFLMLIPSDLDLEISSLHTSIFLVMRMLGRESYGSESGRPYCPEEREPQTDPSGLIWCDVAPTEAWLQFLWSCQTQPV